MILRSGSFLLQDCPVCCFAFFPLTSDTVSLQNLFISKQWCFTSLQTWKLRTSLKLSSKDGSGVFPGFSHLLPLFQSKGDTGRIRHRSAKDTDASAVASAHGLGGECGPLTVPDVQGTQLTCAGKASQEELIKMKYYLAPSKSSNFVPEGFSLVSFSPQYASVRVNSSLLWKISLQHSSSQRWS